MPGPMPCAIRLFATFNAPKPHYGADFFTNQGKVLAVGIPITFRAMKALFTSVVLIATAILLPVPKEVQSDADSPAPIVNRDSAAYFYRLGLAEEAARRPNSALKFYERAAYFNAQDPDILRSIIGASNTLRKTGRALEAMEKLQALSPADAAGAVALTEAYFGNSQWAKAAEWGQRAQKLSPAAGNVDYMIGLARYNQRDYSAALPYLRRAVDAEPDRADAQYYLARLYIQQGAYARSLPHYERTLALAPQPMRAYEYALALSTAGQPEKSITWFSKALELGYDARGDFYTNMAYALSDAKQTKQAITTLQGVLAKRPNDQNILYALAEMHYSAGDYRKAIGYWDDVLKEDKGHARALFMIGKSYIAMGKTQEGQQLCNKAIEMEPALASLRQGRFAQ